MAAQDGGGLFAWVQSIPTAAWTIIITGLFGPASAFGILKWGVERGDTSKRGRNEDTRQDRAEIRQERDAIVKMYKEQIASLKEQTTALTKAHREEREAGAAELSAAERDRDMWEARCRVWYGRAQDFVDQHYTRLWHLAVNYYWTLTISAARGFIKLDGVDDMINEKDRPKLPKRIEE